MERYLDAIGAELDRVGGPDAPALVCLIMHPVYLYAGDPGPEMLDGLLERLAQLRQSGVAGVGPGTEAAGRLRERDGFRRAPVLAAASWA